MAANFWFVSHKAAHPKRVVTPQPQIPSLVLDPMGSKSRWLQPPRNQVHLLTQNRYRTIRATEKVVLVVCGQGQDFSQGAAQCTVQLALLGDRNDRRMQQQIISSGPIEGGPPEA